MTGIDRNVYSSSKQANYVKPFSIKFRIFCDVNHVVYKLRILINIKRSDGDMT